MTKFIALKYTFPDSSGAVLINVDQISNIDLNNGKVYVSIVGKKFSYPVNHTIREIIQMIEIAGAEIVKPAKNDQDTWNPVLYQEIDLDQLLIRTANCFENANIRYFWQLVKYSEQQLLREVKNFGRKSLNEVKQLLAENNLSLGMDLTGFDPQGAQ